VACHGETAQWPLPEQCLCTHEHYVRLTNYVRTVSRMSVMRQPGLVTRGMTLATVLPVCTTRSWRSNSRWNGKTRQKVAGLTFGSAHTHTPNTTTVNIDIFVNCYWVATRWQ